MTIQQLDFAVLDWIQANLKCDALDFLMPKVTLLAEYGVFLILVGLALLFWRSRRVCGLAELSGLVIGLLSAYVFDRLSARRIAENPEASSIQSV